MYDTFYLDIIKGKTVLQKVTKVQYYKDILTVSI